MNIRTGGDSDKLDEAARAGWLYYVAGNTQDEIARKLGVSRQSAQRLVSLAVTTRLVKFRMDHPIARCMELGVALKEEFGLRWSEVVPSDPEAPALLSGLAAAGAVEMERHLKSSEPRIIALGTGRALRASVEQLPILNCPQHRIVSLLGNMMSDGSATPYNVAIRMADRVNARHYPMPLPVLARDRHELEVLHAQEPIHNTLMLCLQADVTFVGIGQIDAHAPLREDGFMTPEEIRALAVTGAVGEITSWVYNRDGQVIPNAFNDRVASAPLVIDSKNPVVGLAVGESKVAAIVGAMRGRLINALVTNEATARAVLEAK